MTPLAAIAVAIFALGFAWQYGGWILEWIGREVPRYAGLTPATIGSMGAETIKETVG